ncbi:sensor histidine kinase [Runella sp. MFBS21]|uniref:sensor histidine kinase n=1 Tax=Runella sp. MFBS21 TaxID=3034018 RepID=UPI0023F61A89|nr:sensor histidine kinase [Runella sp. MFBS21]MDF7816639.1 sensor histidine kinase [Runella sp. MFBS21]
MKNTFALLLMIVLCPRVLWAQQAYINEYRKQLAAEKIDTSRIHIIGDLARMLIMNSDTSEALKLLKEGLQLSQKHRYDYGFGHIYNGYGILYLETSRFVEAEAYFQKSHDYFKKSIKDTAPLGVATALANLSQIAEEKRDIEKAVGLKLKALEVWNATSFPERYVAVGNLYVSIAGLYSKEKLFEKAIYYNKKGIDTRLNANIRDSDLATSYIFLVNAFIRNHQLDSASAYLSTVEEIVNEIKSPVLYMRYYGILGEIAFEKSQFEAALESNKMMLQYAQQSQKVAYEISAHLSIGKCLQRLRQFKQALPFFKQALLISQKNNRLETQKNALQGLAEVSHQLANDKAAFRYLSEYLVLNDSIQAEETKIKLNEIDTKYQTAQKENQILTLEKDKQYQRAWIYSLLGGMLLLAVVIGFGYQNLSNQRKIAQQQTLLKEKEIQQLEKERQLLATNSILKGQEEERTRVARDLHDGLGGILTTVKLTLNQVRGNFILPEASVGVFSRALDQLDGAINEMRRVAHSMMPETLVKYGLIDSLRDFCEDINETGQIRIKYQFLGIDQRLESSTEVILYRIVQELINNILKHAQASEAYLQLIKQESVIHLTVEDNGKGFAPIAINRHKSAGMTNVENRVAYLGGTIDIQSQPNEGTSILIEIPV